jgi:flagellar M-ring protein FliF
VNQQIRAFLERISGYWRQLQPHQRRNLVFAGVFFFLTVALLSWFAFRPNYVAVYSNLEPGTAGEIVTKLDEMKIPNQIQGNSVLVPEEYADRARVQLAMNNLPKSGRIDFGIFNEKSIVGMTEQEFDVKYLTALQGSIENTIRSIKGVNDARVHIVMEQQKLFVQQPLQDAKASVLLQLAPGAQLSPEQVIGIQQLVAGSVRGLQPDHIAILDQNGVRLLEDQAGNGLGNSPGTKEMEVRKQIEKDFQNRIRNALEKLVGYGNVEVIVNADVSFDKVQSTKEIFTPPIEGSTQGIPRSESRTSETYENAPATGGAAGNNTNNVNAQTKAATGTSSTGEKRSSIANFEINKEIVQRVGQPFEIRKVSVSVLVNGQIDNQQKQDITNWVATSIGYRNDGQNNADITVMASTFQSPANPFAKPWYQNPWIIGGIAAGLLLVGGGGYAIARRRAKHDGEEIAPTPVSALSPLPTEETSQQKIRRELDKMIDKKPEEFVNLLRTWLAEE